MNSYLRMFSLVKRSLVNYAVNRPLCVSFEITHSCNARCRHCHRGGTVKETRATPEQFAEKFHELKPVVIQISGGEPLLRKDVEQIIETLKQPDGTPYIIFVTNAALLTLERYRRLLDIGVDFFSVSLDYPDERHDDFRSIPGLFNHIRELALNAGGNGSKAITLNCVVQSDNFRELVKLAERAREWGVKMNYSPYTWLRTNDRDYIISEKDMPEFETVIERLIEFRKKYGVIRTTDSFFYDMAAFFRNGTIPGCRAGERFLVVNPDATLSPCGLIIRGYETWDELKEKFTKYNTCTFCNTCIRATTERPFNDLIPRALSIIRM